MMTLLDEIKSHRNTCRFMAGEAEKDGEKYELSREHYEGRRLAYQVVAEQLTQLIEEHEGGKR